ncbi:MAG: UxaA family hydrolase [Firmicutes bacterium]|nr:UxaA family hydrolase [Bacillota bacterium]
MTEQREFWGIRRPDGRVGVRDYLLALPSVVCSQRAAARAVADLPQGVALAHPVGCAQIGADREITRSILIGMGRHPNVRGTVVVGLGCEGVPAAEVGAGIEAAGVPVSVVTIQAAGGTEEAARQAEEILKVWGAPSVERTRVPISELVLGVGHIEGLGSAGEAVIEAFQARGGQIRRVPPDEAGTSAALTALAAEGVHLIVEQCDAEHVGGHPIVPVVRWGYEPALASALADDWDGLIGERTADEWVDWLLRIAGGELTAAEALGAVTFAIGRRGPTL